MKIKIIKEVAGMPVGTEKNVDSATANELIRDKYAEAVSGEKEEKEPAKRKTKGLK